MTTGSDGACGYEDEWEDEELSVDKKNSVSSVSEQVHPIDSCDDTRDAETTHEEAPPSDPVTKMTDVFDRRLSTAGGSESGSANIKPELCVTDKVTETSQDVPTSDSTRTSDELEVSVKTMNGYLTTSSHTAGETTEAEQMLAIVRVHGCYHHSRHAQPPPGPVTACKVVQRVRATEGLPTPDFSRLHALVAAKRITVYREQQVSKKEEAQTLVSAAIQQRRQIRRSNEAMHKALGVAGLSSQDHLRLAQRRRLLKNKEEEVAANLERQNRWYNNTPKRSTSAPQHIEYLHRQHRQMEHDEEHRVKLRQKTIQRNQAELKKKAKAIISKAHGQYIHGSYLLRITQHTIKSKALLPIESHEEFQLDSKLPIQSNSTS